MRKLFVTLALLFVVSQAHAGTWIGFGNYVPSSDTTYGILSALTPRIVAVRIGIGTKVQVEPSVTVSYGRLSNKDLLDAIRVDGTPIDTFDIDQSTLIFALKGIVPVVKLEKLSFYGFGGLGFTYGSEKTTYQETFGAITKGDYDKESTLGFVIPLGAGVQVNFSKSVSLAFDFESGLSFNKISAEQKRGNTTTDLGSATEFNVALQDQTMRLVLFFGMN